MIQMKGFDVRKITLHKKTIIGDLIDIYSPPELTPISFDDQIKNKPKVPAVSQSTTL